GHFAYPTYAKAAMTRKENLKRSADELKTQLDDAQAALGEACEEQKKVEMLDERDQARERAEANAREQAELDRIGATRFSAGGMRA
ncbi:MAG TPA: flagellar export protein FliJ, partial [Pseudolabrys sp.]|nr:flagellar export protein FliJ [Pseudolabrys sp.]